MRPRSARLLLITILCLLARTSFASEDLAIWRQFVNRLKEGDWSGRDIRPYDSSLTPAFIGFLKTIHQTATWEDFDRTPEVYRQGNRVHFVETVRLNDQPQTLCFTLIEEGDRWYFQQLESILIRLDAIDSLPTSTFPDVDEATKAWMREEFRVSNQVRLFTYLSESLERGAALDWFRDGPGYFLAARAWVPFVEPERAFILYMCWDLTNLQGNQVTLEALDDRHAQIRAHLLYFQIYEHAAHLKPQISLDDYRALFDTVWTDRANAAGWDLDITVTGDECVYSFVRR